MAVSAARQIAFEVLRRAEAEGAYASDVLHAELNAAIKPEDAALATELTLGVLRRRRLLDFLLEHHIKKSVAKLDLPVLLALRLGLYQLRFLHKIPARAAVNESVEIVKRARKTSAAPLVNAVLRRAAEDRTIAEKILPPNISDVERIGILYSHPTWMVERWLARFGEVHTIALLEANNRPSPLSCLLHDAALREEVFAALEKAGLHMEPGRLLRDAFAVSGGSPARTEAFRAGKISIQDEASQAVPLLLGVQPGDRVLDLCAAPGGKTPPLARAAGQNGLTIAADRHAHRLRAMQAQCKRLGLAQVRLVELDAEKALPFHIEFHRILVDAPCSGTGTIARHPEIRWRLRPEQISEFHRLQTGLLMNALGQLARGGRLVYSTCSMEPEENEEVVAEALREMRSIRRMGASEVTKAIEPYLAMGLSASQFFDADGQFRTFPPHHHTDVFFAAVLEKI